MTEQRPEEPAQLIELRRSWLIIDLERNQYSRFGFSLCFRVGPPTRMYGSKWENPRWGFTLDLNAFWGEPNRLYLFGKRYEATIGIGPGNGSQVWDWKRNIWTKRWRWIEIHPADHRRRFELYGK